MEKNSFGRGAERFICDKCGRFFYWIDGCSKCESKENPNESLQEVMHPADYDDMRYHEQQDMEAIKKC